jgi:hypothetical protein
MHDSMNSRFCGSAALLVALLLGLASARSVDAQQPTDSAARADSIARARADSIHADSLHADSVRAALMRTLQARLDSAEKAREDSLRKFQLAAVVVTATRLSTVDERAPVRWSSSTFP